MTDTVTPPEKPFRMAFIYSLPHGGYEIGEHHLREGYWNQPSAAFSTLDEALKWLKKAMEK